MQGSILQPHFRSGCVRKGKGRRRARHCWRSRSDHGKRGASSPGPDLACQMRTENRAARAPGMAREALRMPGTHHPPCRLPPRPAAGAPEPRAERGCRSRAGRAALRRDVPAGTRNASDDRSPFTVAAPRPGPSPQGPGAGLGPRHSPGPARLPGPEARERPRQRGAAPLPPRPRRGSTRRPDRGQARDGAGRVSPERGLLVAMKRGQNRPRPVQAPVARGDSSPKDRCGRNGAPPPPPPRRCVRS